MMKSLERKVAECIDRHKFPPGFAFNFFEGATTDGEIDPDIVFFRKSLLKLAKKIIKITKKKNKKAGIF